MAEIRAHIPMAKKWWTGGETVRKRSSQTIGKTTPSSIDPFDEKGHARISAACNCPYVFTVLSPRLHLSLSLELRDLSRHVPPDPIRLLVDRRFTNPAGANRKG